MFQALGGDDNNGRELSLGRPKGGRLVEFNFPFISTIISGLWLLAAQ